jgi:beta-lactamase superfamily II metal-dependent hydrolase
VTFQTSETKGHPAPSASEEITPSAEVYILQCGQGDTILLNLGGKKWVLVDCNLPRGDLRAQFYQFVERLEIRRLDLVCLTHPHDDHYSGMAEVVRYFTSNGRSIGTFCDSGVEPKQIATLMRRRRLPKSTVTEFEQLYRCLYELIDSRQVRYFMASENSSPFIEVGNHIQITPLGPRPEALSQALRDVASAGKIRKDLNRISVVLVLNVQGKTKSFDALLAADTDSEGCNSALKRYAAIKAQESAGCTFDLVKVPHHGSAYSHCGSEICRYRKEDDVALAAISAGPFDALPDREVMRDYLQYGWTVLLTTKRGVPCRQLAVELSGRRQRVSEVQGQSIRITWQEDRGTRWEPAQARVCPDELPNYKSVYKRPTEEKKGAKA